jgi:endoglycosylceramidase
VGRTHIRRILVVRVGLVVVIRFRRQHSERWVGNLRTDAHLQWLIVRRRDPRGIDIEQPADQNAIGWMEWSYSDTTYGGVDRTTEWLVKDPSQQLVGDNVNAANLQTLSRPYAQVIAGTPGAFSFADGTFQFSYSTERADGAGAFAAGSETVISVPASQYPNGYQVNIVGGHVVSAPNAPQLVIASDGGASTVTVTVSPIATT